MGNYDRSETRTVKTGSGILRYHKNWDQEGAIVMENPQTISRYKELREAQPNMKELGVFFAFSDEQLEKGIKDLIERGKIKSTNELKRGIGGMFGTEKAMDAVYDFYANNRHRMKEECDPQEVYFYEYNNYECMCSWDGDKEAYKTVEQIFGKSCAKKIKRVL